MINRDDAIKYIGLSVIPTNESPCSLSRKSKYKRTRSISQYGSSHKCSGLDEKIYNMKYIYKLFNIIEDNYTAREWALIKRKILFLEKRYGIMNYKPTLKHKYYLTHIRCRKGLDKYPHKKCKKSLMKIINDRKNEANKFLNKEINSIEAFKLRKKLFKKNNIRRKI